MYQSLMIFLSVCQIDTHFNFATISGKRALLLSYFIDEGADAEVGYADHLKPHG